MDETENTLGQREEALKQREAALGLRERRLQAREALKRLRLPEALNDQLDLSSEEGLQRSLGLAEQLYALARLESAQTQAPKRFVPTAEAAATLNYQERAALYQQDRESYQQHFGGDSTWMSR